MNNFTFSDLKKAAKELKIPKYTTAKTKEDLVKLMRPHAKVQGKKIVSKAEGGRCWSGYEPVKGKKPFEKGSCKKASGGAIYNPTGDPEVSRKNEQIRENMQKARDAKDKNQEKKLLGGRIKYPGESFKQKQPTQDQNRVIYDPMKDREYKKRMLDDQFRENMILQMEIVDRIYGGTLPQSFRNTVSELKLIKGGSCEKPQACDPIKKQISKEEAKYAGQPFMGNPKKARELQEQYKQCVAEERARQGCPESGYGGKNKTAIGISRGFANFMDTINPITQISRQNPGLGRKLGGEAQKGVAMTMIAGQPAFLATCGAAGAAAGGPLGAAMGAAACKALYDKLAAKHVSNYADMAGLSTEEIEMVQLLGTFAANEGVKQANPETAREPGDYIEMGVELADRKKEEAKEYGQKQLDKGIDKGVDYVGSQIDKTLDSGQKEVDKITKPINQITKPIEQMETYRDKPDNVSSNDWQYLWDNKPAQYSDAEWSEKINTVLVKKMSGGKVGKEEIDWDKMDWGSFSKQLERYNSQHKSKQLNLPQFAEMILKDPSKYQKKTVRRARFYKNVLEKPKK